MSVPIVMLMHALLISQEVHMVCTLTEVIGSRLGSSQFQFLMLVWLSGSTTCPNMCSSPCLLQDSTLMRTLYDYDHWCFTSNHYHSHLPAALSVSMENLSLFSVDTSFKLWLTHHTYHVYITSCMQDAQCDYVSPFPGQTRVMCVAIFA